MPDLFTMYTTCPSSSQEQASYHDRLVDVARWTEAAGFRGLLVYSDNSLVSPWLVAQLVIQHTASVRPLVAVQPAYTHPYTVASMASSLALLHGRAIDLNMVTGGFPRQLAALGDALADNHDERYTRLVDYTRIVIGLLDGTSPVAYTGSYYAVDKLQLLPSMRADLAPWLYLSGASVACRKAAEELGATRLSYPSAPQDLAAAVDGSGTPLGIRIGVIARPDSAQAWSVAEERFPHDPSGATMHRIARAVSDSVWHGELSASAAQGSFWLHPFRTYKTFCPYIVGDYDEVATVLAHYHRHGIRTVLLDVPATEDDLHHTRVALARAADLSIVETA